MSVCCSRFDTAMYPKLDNVFSSEISWQKRSVRSKVQAYHIQDRRSHLPPLPPRGLKSCRIRRPEAEKEDGITRQPPVPKRIDFCKCCYEELPSCQRHQVSCSSGKHKFCTDCIKQYIETWVYGESYPLRDTTKQAKALPCLADAESQCFFPSSLVKSLCSHAVWKAYQDKMVRIMNADVVESFSAKGVESDYHACDDETVVTANTLNEALTEAKVRRCPQCKTAFLKEAGCNRITCPSCRTTICYLCLEHVSRGDYQHFCNHSYDKCAKNCGKCPLWTTQDETMDHRRLVEVSNQANEAWERELLHSSVSAV